MKTKETNKQKKNRKNGGEGGPAYSRREIFKKQTKTRKKKKTIGTRHSKRFPSITVAERSVSFHLENH